MCKKGKLHCGGLPEEVIGLEGRPHAIIVVLCGLFNVVSARPEC